MICLQVLSACVKHTEFSSLKKALGGNFIYEQYQ